MPSSSTSSKSSSPSSSTAPTPADVTKPAFDNVSSANPDEYEPYQFPKVKKDLSLKNIPYRIFRSIFFLVYIFLTAVAANFVLLLCIPIYLVSPYYGAKAASFSVGWTCWVLWCIFIENNLTLEFYGDELGPYENSVCIANHVSSADFILVLSMALRGRMLGNVKYFAKKSISYIPLVGWGMSMLGMIFLNRNWMSDRSRIDNTFRYLRENFIPVWIVCFLEGTRVTPKKMKQSIKFQKQRGLTVTTQVMAPRVKGLMATLKGLPDLEYIYDFTFAYVTGVFSCTDLFWQAHPEGSRICVHVNRIAVKDLPLHDEEELKKFIYNLYVKKDKVLKSIRKDKDGNLKFPGKARVWPLDVKNWWTAPFERSKQKKMAKLESKKEQ